MIKVILLSMLWVTLAVAEEFHVVDRSSFDAAAKKVQPGDVIVLKDGRWKDVTLRVDASGSAERPITIKAASLGKVILTGASRISLGGGYIVVDGLWFQNPSGSESIELRINSKKIAHHCRITNCAVTEDRDRPGMKGNSLFLSIHGSQHRVDHCYFAGKTSGGPTVVVWLAKGRPAAHRMDHNHFGPRPPLGRNGGETIRIGDSKSSMLTAACIVEDNLFEKCDGESECISNKSCGNLYARNHFLSVSGTLTLRHGNDCRVEGNVFLGNGVSGSGGVRVIGEGHRVIGNHFQDLKGGDARAALCMMQGIENSPLHEYFQVKRASIIDNVFLNCQHNFVIGSRFDKKANLPPVGSVIAGNKIQTNRAKAFEILCDVGGIKLERNDISKERPANIGKIPPLPEVGPSWWSGQ